MSICIIDIESVLHSMQRCVGVEYDPVTAQFLGQILMPIQFRLQNLILGKTRMIFFLIGESKDT